MHLVLGKPIRVWARMPIPIEHRHVAPPFGQSINDLVVDLLILTRGNVNVEDEYSLYVFQRRKNRIER